GSCRWLAWTATPAMTDGTIYAAARDITNVVLAEEESLRSLHDQLTRVQSALQSDCLTAAFQPIVDIQTHRPRGWEALARFDLEPHRPPDQWFADADAVGLGFQLEMRAIQVAVASAVGLPD